MLRDRVGEDGPGHLRVVPVVVVVEDFGLQSTSAESRPDMTADDHCTVRRVHAHAGIILRLEIGLVLDCEHRHRHALATELFHGLREVVREGGVIFGNELTLVEVLRGLHPRGSTPRADHHLEVRVDRQRLARAGQHVLTGVVDREMLKLRIGGVPRRVVVAVMLRRKIRCSDRQPSEGKAEAVRPSAEQLGHQRLTFILWQPAQKLRRRIGYRRAEAVHLLKMLRRIDRHGLIASGGACRLGIGLR